MPIDGDQADAMFYIAGTLPKNSVVKFIANIYSRFRCRYRVEYLMPENVIGMKL
jgi:hypothetical protein